MQHTKHCPEGLAERLTVLAGLFEQATRVVSEITEAHRRSVLGQDDVLDALVAAVTALLSRENSRTLPELPEQDAHGLRMEMVYAQTRS
jgi:predicted RNase H-like nuclease